MREIKFRGKSKMTVDELDEMHFIHDNGWFVGNLIMHGEQPYIVGDLIEVDSEYIIHEFWVPVHKESIGQYTGLKDIKGNEIYEGDILRTVFSWSGDEEVHYVYFEKGSFKVERNKAHDNYIYLDEEDYLHEVIGNIYEHKYLLEG